ncbi:MAG: TolC family protein [Bacillota bacterium]
MKKFGKAVSAVVLSTCMLTSVAAAEQPSNRQINVVIDGTTQIFDTQQSKDAVGKTTDDEKNKDEVLSYGKAVEMALQHSYELRNKNANLSRAEELNENTTLTLGTYNPNLIKAKNNLNTQEEWAKKQIQISEESIAYQVKSKMNEINKLLSEAALSDLDMQNTKLKLDIAETKYKKGMVSEYDLSTARQNYEQKKKQKEALNKSIDSAYLKLNQMVGLSQDKRYVLEEHISYVPMEEMDIDYHVTKALHDDPYIWNQQKQIESAELGVKLYEYNVGDDPYAVKEIDVTTAKNNLGNMKQKLEQSLRSKYNQIKQLEDNYEVQKISLAKAEENLNLIRIKFDEGMVVEQQLREVEFAVEQAKLEMKKTAIQHEDLKTLLKQPYLQPDYI